MDKITIAMIAKKAGVSPATVSNAMNNRNGSVGNEKKRMILQVAEKLGYVHVHKKIIIRFLIVQYPEHPVDINPFFSVLIRGVEDTCNQQGYKLLINHVNVNELHEIIHRLDEQFYADGLLILGTVLGKQELDECQTINRPFVLIDDATFDQRFNIVAINNRDTIYLMTEYLINKGHRNIGFIGSGSTINNYHERKLGFMQALHDNGLEINHLYNIPAESSGEIDYKKMTIRLQKIMKLKNPPTAYCAVNDFSAIIFCRAMRELGIHLSVTGFDDIPDAASNHPPLTTAKIDEYAMGVNAIKRLADLIDSPEQSPIKIYVASKFVERSSVKKVNKQ